MPDPSETPDAPRPMRGKEDYSGGASGTKPPAWWSDLLGGCLGRFPDGALRQSPRRNRRRRPWRSPNGGSFRAC